MQGWKEGFYNNEKVNELDKLVLYKYKESKMNIIVKIIKKKTKVRILKRWNFKV
jgi:hypothetical protein